MYPNDADLFEACFGKKPKGKVEVVKGPMTLFFRCFYSRDYTFVYSYDKHGGDDTKIEPDDFSKADSTGGVALVKVGIDELRRTVTVENVSNNNPGFEFIKGIERKATIHHEKVGIYLDPQEEDVEIRVKGAKGVGVWKLKIVERNERGEPARIQFINLTEADPSPIFDVARVEATDERRSGGNVTGLLRHVRDGKLCFNIIEYLKVGGQISGHININNFDVEIEDYSAHGTTITYKEGEFVMVPNKKVSEQVRIHEDQHQFNKLFEPFEVREDMFTMMRRVAEGAKTPEEAVKNLIHGLVRLERRWIGFDSRARDEILAQYKGGRSVERTFKNLTELKLYDYAEQFKDEIEKIPAHVKKRLEEEVSEVYYGQFEDEDGGGLANFAEPWPLEVKEYQITPYVESVSKDEYKADLKNWLASITVLEQKGYTRDEIVSLLYQEPVNSWPNLARRIGPKIKP